MRTCNIELTSYGDCPFFFLCLTVNVGPFSCRSCSSSSAGMRTEYSSWKKERFQWVIQQNRIFSSTTYPWTAVFIIAVRVVGVANQLLLEGHFTKIVGSGIPPESDLDVMFSISCQLGHLHYCPAGHKDRALNNTKGKQHEYTWASRFDKRWLS